MMTRSSANRCWELLLPLYAFFCLVLGIAFRMYGVIDAIIVNVVSTLVIGKYLFGNKYSKVSNCSIIAIIFVSFAITILCWLDPIKKSNIRDCYYGVFEGTSTEHGRSTYYYMKYRCLGADTIFERRVEVDLDTYKSKDDSVKRVLISGKQILKWNATETDSLKSIYPMKTREGGFCEIGNNSYEYARFEPNREYDNFGFNVVYLSFREDDNINISWETVIGKSQKMQAPAGIRDTFLVYSNINPKFFDGWHVCPDSISTPENFAKIEEGGYGYIFRGKIYSKEETEKYWNIIEQYKLRETGE